MKIALIGTGNVSSSLSEGWARAGHEIFLGSRDPQGEKAAGLANKIGARALSPAEAAQAAGVVVLAVPWSAAEATLRDMGDLSGKVLIDAVNALGPGFQLMVSGETSVAEQIAGWVPEARVVKAFNMVGSATMQNPVFPGGRAALFLCGDDPTARETVKRLAEDLGFDVYDAGDLRSARLLEPMAALWVSMAYGRGLGPDSAFGILKR